MGKEIYLWIILYLKIQIWNLLSSVKSSFSKLEGGLMKVYKTLYMQNTIWSLLQDNTHNMN
jgi:hypothetical protein